MTLSEGGHTWYTFEPVSHESDGSRISSIFSRRWSIESIQIVSLVAWEDWWESHGGGRETSGAWGISWFPMQGS